MEIYVTYQSVQMGDWVLQAVRHLLIDRHREAEDFSITIQVAMLESLEEIMLIFALAAVVNVVNLGRPLAEVFSNLARCEF